MNNAELIAEARDVLGRVNTNAVYHDSLFQYRGGVLVRELTLIVRDLADALEAAETRIAEAAKLHRPTLPGFGPKSCVHDGRAWPCPDSIALGLNEGRKRGVNEAEWGDDLQTWRCPDCPVQPSSTVDEGALAEVIRRSYENEQGLKIRDDKRTARAVAEWLRGESR